jgi:hypothetical protein
MVRNISRFPCFVTTANYSGGIESSTSAVQTQSFSHRSKKMSSTSSTLVKSFKSLNAAMLLRAQTCENRLLALRPIRLVFHHLGSEVAVTDGLQFRPRGYESLADDFDVRPKIINRSR